MPTHAVNLHDTDLLIEVIYQSIYSPCSETEADN